MMRFTDALPAYAKVDVDARPTSCGTPEARRCRRDDYIDRRTSAARDVLIVQTA